MMGRPFVPRKKRPDMNRHVNLTDVQEDDEVPEEMNVEEQATFVEAANHEIERLVNMASQGPSNEETKKAHPGDI